MLSMPSLFEDLMHCALQFRHVDAFFRFGDCYLLRSEVQVVGCLLLAGFPTQTEWHKSDA